VINRVTLIGRLGKDPEFRDGTVPVAKFSLATDSKRKDASGNLVSETEWHRIVCFRRQAEIARDYLRKGSLVYLEGRIHYDSYENKDGQKVYTTEILADNFQMLGGKSEQTQQAAPAPAPAQDLPDGDLPF
jgi:single-strand DNA-binding protein